MSEPLAYFMTFRTYGTWLHGDPRGSVDPKHNHFFTPFLEPNSQKQSSARNRMNHPPVTLTPAQQQSIATTLTEVTTHHRWKTHATHIGSTHIHIILTAPNTAPEKILNSLKSYATRNLRKSNLVPPNLKLWSRHGSTPHLYTDQSLLAAIHYVLELQ